MSTNFIRDHDGNIKFEHGDDWPWIISQISERERVIYTADGRRIALQRYFSGIRNDKWSKWRIVARAASPEELRQLMEGFTLFAYDPEVLDAVCLKTDEGDYVRHNH
jgi:hypothetical protein